MSWNRSQVRAQARVFAKDNSAVTTYGTDDTTVNALFTDVYARYDHAILRERVKLLSASFLTLSAGSYIGTSSVAALDLTNLENGAEDGSNNTAAPLERDDYYAVVADTESASNYNVPEGLPVRWGALKLQGSTPGYWRIAVYPTAPSGSPSVFAGWGHASVTPITDDSTNLDCEDIDALNISRLLAAEIMLNNGDDPAAIQGVLGPLDKTVQAKFAYLMQRSPRRLPDTKEP